MSSSIDISDSQRSFSARYDVGDLIGGKYELLRKAGEGAMGTVWVAINKALDLHVAIKLIKPELRSPAIDARLLREARAVAMLSHSAIVRVFDRGETSRGDPYIVMELLEGESLGRVLQREKRMTPESAIALLLPVASAISAAHERGIVHRDLKPDNIMLTQSDAGGIQPKVVDFGVAKLTWVGPGHKSTGTAMIGTPDYMAPEQALALDTVDHRADIWAFCAMLYELISGEVPFASNNAFRVLCAVVQTPVRSLVERCGLDPALWALIERGLRKEPTERWPTMRELGEALATWLSERGVREDVCGASLRTQWFQRGETQRPRSDPQATPVVISLAPAVPLRVEIGEETFRSSDHVVPSAPHPGEEAPSLPLASRSRTRAERLRHEPVVELALQRTLRGAGNEVSRMTGLSLRGRLALGAGALMVAAVMVLVALVPAHLAGSFGPLRALAETARTAPSPTSDATVEPVRAFLPPPPESVRRGPTGLEQAGPIRSGVATITSPRAARALPRKPMGSAQARRELGDSPAAALPKPEDQKAQALTVASVEVPSEAGAENEARRGLMAGSAVAEKPEEALEPFAEHATRPATSQTGIDPEP